MDILLVRPGQTLVHSRVHGTIFELEPPFWFDEGPLEVISCRPPSHVEALSVRSLDPNERQAGSVRPTERPRIPNAQIVLVGGVEGATYQLKIGRHHLTVRVAPTRDFTFDEPSS